MKSIHIFKAGTHTSAGGTTLDFSEAALQATAANYDPAISEAPIVVGHPKDNGPAFGWVGQIEFNETGLHAKPRQINDDFMDQVQNGAYKKVSASFYSPDAPSNPTPGNYYLRHVGFLGAMPPALKGLEAVQFSEAEEGVVEFSAAITADDFEQEATLLQRIASHFGLTPKDNQVTDDAEPSTQEQSMNQEQVDQARADLEADRAELESLKEAFAEQVAESNAAAAEARNAEFAERVNGLVEGKKLVPAQAEKVLAFAKHLDADAMISFGEGEDDNMGAAEMLFSILDDQANGPDFNEAAPSEGAEPEPLTDNDIASKAVAFRNEQKGKGIAVSFTEAVQAVTQ